MDSAEFVLSREKYEQFLASLKDEEVKEVLNFVKDSRRAKKSKKEKSISDMFEELSSELPLENWQELPVDGAENHDHYLYGAHKKNE